MSAVRGTVRAHVDELDTSGVARTELRDFLVRSAVPLSSLRDALGADEGEIVDELGDSHPLLIADWADRSPDTLLTISFTYQQSDAPSGFRGSTYPPDVLSLVRGP